MTTTLLARAVCLAGFTWFAAPAFAWAEPGVIELPRPQTESDRSLERTLADRRSSRRFAATSLDRATLGQLLWAAQGITSPDGKRTAPSAGARYPLELFVLLPAGVFRYMPAQHALRRVTADDRRKAVWADTYARPWLADSPAIFVITAVYERTRRKYGAKADRFVHVEAGHVGQNLLLQATARELLCVPIGAFHQRRVQQTLGISEVPIYFVAVGHPPS